MPKSTHGYYWDSCFKNELRRTGSPAKALRYADLMEKYRKNGVPIAWGGQYSGKYVKGRKGWT